jgi:AraC family transcriptional regulator of adaptative response/methylated-DNA-[protein]-cysteine methyltransferase
MTGFANQVVDFRALTAAPERLFWGCHDSPLGPLLMGVTREGLCRLEFASGYGLGYDLARWQEEWKETRFIPDAAASAAIACQFHSLTPWKWGLSPLALYGTEFQLKVWKAILQIEPGSVMSFSELAGLIGKPGAGKAVGMAVSANPVPLMVPCHRVVPDDGAPRHMNDRQRLLLALEERGYRFAS